MADRRHPPPWFFFRDAPTWTNAIRSYAVTIGPTQFDAGLKPQPPPQGRRPDTRVPSAAHHTPNPADRTNNGRAAQRPNARPNAASNATAHTNTNHHPALRAFWSSQESARLTCTMGQMLQAADSSLTAVFTNLGLDVENDCARFHLRDRCTSATCPRQHNTRDLPTAAATEAANLLRTGLEACS